MFRCIRAIRLLPALVIATVILVLPPSLGLSPAGSGDQGGGSPILTDGGKQVLGDGGTDGSDPDEFGIYVGNGRSFGKSAGSPGFHSEGEVMTSELSGFWVAILRMIWMVRY